MDKYRVLREKLKASGPIVAASAHNGLSAKLVEEAGFDAVWASGFEVSASQAVPDANILTFTENLHLAKQINDAVSIPVIADCDNGYGNAINVIRTVREYEKAGIAAICIEDNVFPKRCSFYPGVLRDLVPIEENVGKIQAAKGYQENRDMVVIARIEALIAGWGMEEALKRGRAYADAGADIVLIHSKASTEDEVKEFASRWDRDCPLAAIPTTYPQASAQELEEQGFKLVIFANHTVRSAIRAMRQTLHTLRQSGRASDVEGTIASLEDVYSLVGVSQLQEDESRFLPVGGKGTKAIIVAAGYEKELLPLIQDRPKSMLDIKGKSILERQIESVNACNIKDIVVVRGYKKETIDLPNIRYYDNDSYEDTYILSSLFHAAPEVDGRFIFLYGDILFDHGILEKLLHSPKAISLVVDRSWQESHAYADDRRINNAELVVTAHTSSQSFRFLPAVEPNEIVSIGKNLDAGKAQGEFIGMAMFSEEGTEILREVYRKAPEKYGEGPFHGAISLNQASFTDIVQEILDQGYPVHCVDTYKGWMEVDTFEDYRRAWAELR